MEVLVSFLISVLAGVISYYICKWLDGNTQTASPKENPRGCLLWGFRFMRQHVQSHSQLYIILKQLVPFVKSDYFTCVELSAQYRAIGVGLQKPLQPTSKKYFKIKKRVSVIMDATAWCCRTRYKSILVLKTKPLK